MITHKYINTYIYIHKHNIVFSFTDAIIPPSFPPGEVAADQGAVADLSM